MFKASFLNQQQLPLVLEPAGNHGAALAGLIALCHEQQDFLRARLRARGALLLRGYHVTTPEGFAQFVSSFSAQPAQAYVGGASPRIKLGGGIYTSTEYPAHHTLSLHNELSYNYWWPEQLYFCCITPASQGGETPLGDSRALLRRIPAEIVREFKERKIRYDRNLPGGAGVGLSWQAAFETDDRAQVEAYCRAGAAQFRWKEDGGLLVSQVRPATARHRQTGEEVWFNQAESFHPSGMDRESYQALISLMPEEEFPLNAYFGDGAPLDPALLDQIRQASRDEMALFAWQTGDILVLDNMLAAHGRMPFSGPRKILLAMT